MSEGLLGSRTKNVALLNGAMFFECLQALSSFYDSKEGRDKLWTAMDEKFQTPLFHAVQVCVHVAHDLLRCFERFYFALF